MCCPGGKTIVSCQKFLSKLFKCQGLPIHCGLPLDLFFLGPLLFPLYINDLPGVCPEISAQMHADYAVILIHGKNLEAIADPTLR